MKAKLSILAAAVLAVASPVFAADAFTVDKGHSSVQFTIRHLISKIAGRFTDVEGTIQVDRAKPEASTVEFTIKTASIDTGEKRRDDHLRSPDFFDATAHPDITFKSTKVASAGKDAYKVTGNFTLHGVTKEITVPVTVLGEGKDPQGNDRIGFETATTVNRKDYNIVWNRALDAGGTVLGDDVAIVINLETVKKKDAPAAPAAK